MLKSEARILAVENDRLSRELLVRILSNSGFVNIASAENGKKALEQLAESPFDLLITDIMMPEMDGKELIRRIRCSKVPFNNIPILVITALKAKNDIQQVVKFRVNGYIIKPFNITAILKKIGQILNIPLS